MQQRNNVKTRLALVASLLAVAASTTGCWGDDDDDDDQAPTAAAPVPVPASAGTDVTSYFTFLGGLTGAPTDTGEPLDINSFTPPVSDTAEPSPI